MNGDEVTGKRRAALTRFVYAEFWAPDSLSISGNNNIVPLPGTRRLPSHGSL